MASAFIFVSGQRRGGKSAVITDIRKICDRQDVEKQIRLLESGHIRAEAFTTGCAFLQRHSNQHNSAFAIYEIQELTQGVLDLFEATRAETAQAETPLILLTTDPIARHPDMVSIRGLSRSALSDLLVYLVASASLA